MQFNTTATVYDIIILRNETEKYQINLTQESFYYPLIDKYETLL